VEPKDPESVEFEVVDGEVPEGPDYSAESDLLFRVQNRVTDAFYTHWKKGLTVLVSFLLIVLIYGLWQTKVENAQKATSETLAKIDRKMPEVSILQLQGQWALDDPTDTKRIKTLEAIAKKFEEVAGDSTGTASTEAWLKAGDTWMRVANVDSAKGAYTQVLENQSSGLFAIGAHNGMAALLIGGNDSAAALTHYRSIADQEDNAFGEAALLSIARVARGMGDAAVATAALDELAKRFPDSLRGAEIEWERQRIGAGEQG
jgi:tetratricopeptide (TPR) repeat protein